MGYLLLLVPITGAAFLATHPVFNVIVAIVLVSLTFGTAPDWESEFSKKHLLLSGGPVPFLIAVNCLTFHMVFITGEVWYDFQENALMPFITLTSILNLVVVYATGYQFVKTANVLWWREYYERNK